MKILIITDEGFENGGVSTYVRSIRKTLEHRKHIVRILSSNIYFGNNNFNDYEFEGVKDINSFKYYLNRLFNFKAYYKTKQIINNFKPDIVHLNSIDCQGSPSIFYCLKNIPAVMTLHNYSLICSDDEINYLPNKKSLKGYIFEKIKKYLYLKSINYIDLFISPSNKLELYFRDNNILNIQTIYNGVNLLRYLNIKKEMNLLYMGRLSKEKGAIYLLKAMPTILNNFPKIHLHIIGKGPEKEYLYKLVNKLGITNNVTFIDHVTNDKVEHFYENSAITIIPSVCEESFSLVGIEAMSVGRPVIASKVGGIPEWLEDGQTGYLVDPGNSEQIAEKVIKLLSNKKLLLRMGINANRKSKKYSIEYHVDQLEKTYTKILNKYLN